MDEVVGGGADSRIDEISEHEEVRSEKEDGEEEPACVEVLVREQSGEQEGGFFKTEKYGWPV
jgi:hypothetical protein